MPRRKTDLLGCVLACLLFLGATRATPAEEPAHEAPPTWYALSLRSSDSGLQATHYWSKGSRLRSETLLGGVKVVTLVEGEDYVTYDAVNRRGMSIKRHPDSVVRDAVGRRPFGNEYERMLARGAESVGGPDDKLVNLRLTDDFGRRELQVTRDPDRIPIRYEIWHRESNQRLVTDYMNWRNDLELPDSFFEPEAGVELQEFSLEAYMALASSPERTEGVPVLHGDLLAPQP